MYRIPVPKGFAKENDWLYSLLRILRETVAKAYHISNPDLFYFTK